MTPEHDSTSVPLPPILVVIPTRNRASDLGRCLESLAAVAYPDWGVLIVDQSDDEATARLAGTYRDRLPRLTYLHMAGRGQCRGRNAGLRRAGTRIVAYLDDDCTVDSGWLTAVAAAFRRYPSATLVFGSVHAIPHDPLEVVIPAVIFEREQAVLGAFQHGQTGMGASMYLWPARSQQQRRFDVHLGPGTRWPAADEGDYARRVILAGEPVVLTPSVRVTHHGARSLQGGAAGKLIRGYMLANGAMDMKMIRCGDWKGIGRASGLIRLYLHTVLSALATGKRPLGLGALLMYVRGLAESFLLPVDRARCLYLPARPAARVRRAPR